MIGIINYGLGNLSAFYNIYKRLNVKAEIVSKPSELEKSTKLILPGVGSYDHALNCIEISGIKDVLNKLVLIKKVPVLGICIGMHIMGKNSEEGSLSGLNWIDGSVRKLNSNCIQKNKEYDKKLIHKNMPLPHLGWNNCQSLVDNPLTHNIKELSFYFLHSYYISPRNSEDIKAITKYTQNFCSIVNHENIYGVQFHPEKSHENGTNLLLNFSKI